MQVTAPDVVHAINQLSKKQEYNYINPSTKGKIIIDSIELPEGPINIRRYDPSKGEARNGAKLSSISDAMIWRVANAIRPGIPLNIDRVLGASYNTRSVLESLLAYTPQYYYCYPGRIQLDTSTKSVKRGHKHLLFLPDNPHAPGVLERRETDTIISEIPTVDAVYEALVLPENVHDEGFDIEVSRRHVLIQIALIEIGKQLGFRTWVAQNDRGIIYKDRRLAEMESVIGRLEDEQMLNAFHDAQRAARLIDCIWFKNGKLMPAVIEVEHSTRVRSGLTRMKTLQDFIPGFRTRWVIAAADDDRNLVMREAATEQFRSLNAQYFPYSAIEELYSLCQRRKIRGVTEEFLDSFMEPCLPLLP